MSGFAFGLTLLGFAIAIAIVLRHWGIERARSKSSQKPDLWNEQAKLAVPMGFASAAGRIIWSVAFGNSISVGLMVSSVVVGLLTFIVWKITFRSSRE